MSAPDDRDPEPNSAAATGRRRFLKRVGALVVVAPVAVALHAAATAHVADAAPAKKPRGKARPVAPATSADPFAAGRPDLSIARTAEERATLERQWKGMLDLVKVIRDAPLDPATEPATFFAALPRSPNREG